MMSPGFQLSQPILAEIANDGRLIRADEALVRLNQRAGGIEGGVVAIPALAQIAQMSLQLQMQLSRAVRVADGNEKLELWVEVKPEKGLAKLSILSWQNVPFISKLACITDRNTSSGDNLVFDHASRLVSAGGIAARRLNPANFGQDGHELLATVFNASPQLTYLLDAFSRRENISGCTLTRSFDQQLFLVSGQAEGQIYRLVFDASKVSDEKPEPNFDLRAPEAMFGKHLAPALRQPLGRIIANAETIGSELQGPIRENYALYARDIANAARHLSALVDDLGDLEAIDRPDFKTARDTIELGDVARRVGGLLALKAADHRIEIKLPAELENVTVIAEFRRTLQILLNLLNNAIRYSPDGTAISLELSENTEFGSISVIDQGAGIKLADRARIFEKFERLGRSGDGGSGLGLYISRRLALAMSGELSVQDAEGGGAKFTLRLPKT